MNKEELIKATQILQKHIPNRYPLQNAYIDAMNEYAEWYHEEKSKLSQHDVSGSLPSADELAKKISEMSDEDFEKNCKRK
jgi:hypothetical protein